MPAWSAATRRGDLLLDDGPAGHLKPGSLRKHAAGYGRWLTWLGEAARIEEEHDPAARATPQRVAAFIAALRQLNAPRTVLSRVTDLATVLGWFAPERDWGWLNRILARLRGRVRPVRDKRTRLRSAHELLALGRRLMQTAAADDETPPLALRERARLYRDGLMIACLALRPLRLANFAQLELGRDLVQRGDGWWLEIAAARTKTGEPIEVPFPQDLEPELQSYLATWRPRLARAEYLTGNPALWPTQRGTTISSGHAFSTIIAHTRAAFARPVNPHLFRDAAATTIALDRPEQVRMAARLLGHRSFATTERYYNLARAAEAARAWQKILEAGCGSRGRSRRR